MTHRNIIFLSGHGVECWMIVMPIELPIWLRQTVSGKSLHHQDLLTDVGVVLELLEAHIDIVGLPNLLNQNYLNYF